MTHKELFFKTTTREEFVQKVKKISPYLCNKTISKYYSLNVTKFGEQTQIQKKYYKKYAIEYALTTNVQDFVKLCKKYYKNDRTSNFFKRYHELKKFYKKNVVLPKSKKKIINDIIEPEKKFINIPEKKLDENYIPLNDLIEPAPIKLLELDDMKRFGYKITRQFLRHHGFTNFEINWLEYKKLVKE